jgi:hypothetical protein
VTPRTAMVVKGPVDVRGVTVPVLATMAASL